ncbi:DL-endopeptidase inhibitor IseA family protein [Paenibacillus sp. JSM ZJ436]|uniref:DL-endopeptidase inhibitor IseA family protein n=1 Tax=Paenibacillus sp. JSM ZJ436 TaxID=3376190 RepID=UPI0037A11AB9
MSRKTTSTIMTAAITACLLVTGAAYAADQPAAAKNQQASKSAASDVKAPQAGLLLTHPVQAAELYAFGLQKRNAHIQYASFTDSLKKKMANTFEKLKWVTGSSSSWITSWEITRETKLSSTKHSVELKLNTATLSGPSTPATLKITVVKAGSSWLVDAVSLSGELTRSGLAQAPASRGADLGIQDAQTLAAKAASAYWYMTSGGKLIGTVEEFSIPGIGNYYRWMGKDLDTIAELNAFLVQVFTPEQSKSFIDGQLKAGALVEINGRLAQPNADGGSRLMWSKAKATLLKDGKTDKVFSFSVPVGEKETETVVIAFTLTAQGWKVNEAIGTIR